MRRRWVIVCLIGAAALTPKAAEGQYPFGKNKVVYSNKDWKILQTEHVDIYHYPSEKSLVLSVAPLVEETYAEYSEFFGVDFRDRVPLVFYSTHYEFEQTNIIPTLISEFTGGFTDLIKGRIAIPFTGSMGDLRHVVRHEMVHAFMLEKISQVMSEHHRYVYHRPPLWFVEGLAEYLASPYADTQSRMFVRDALINGKLPDLERMWLIEGGFMMYKEGEAVIRFIATNFGRESLRKILDNWWRNDRFENILKMTINMNLRELNEDFMRSLKRRYYPAILHGSFASEQGTKITPPNTFHSRPACTVDSRGEPVVYALCAQHGVIDICSLRKRGGRWEDHRIVVQGGMSSSLEAIPAFRSKIEIHGDTLLFVSKRKEKDVIYFWSLSSKQHLAAFSFPGLSIVSSPSFSHRLGLLVFSAIDTSGVMNLYLYRLASGRLEKVTDDPFSEEDPDFHPYLPLVLFSSDRCGGGKKGKEGIYLLNINTGKMRALLCGDSYFGKPDWSPGGEGFLFVSDRDGTFDIYYYRGGAIIRQTRVLGGMDAPSFHPNGKSFVAVGYSGGRFDLYTFPLHQGRAEEAVNLARADSSSGSSSGKRGPKLDYKTKDYNLKLGIDFIGTGLAVDPDFGELGNGGELVLSDILGDHQFYLFFGNSSEGLDDFWKRMNLGITYVNLSHRLNYLLSVFHLTTYWGDYSSLFRSERRYGAAAGLSYPFSKFSRLDGSLVVRAVERQSNYAGYSFNDQSSVLATSYLSYVTDNTIWTVGGPLKGWRYYITAGHTFDLLGRGFESTSLHFDLRRYFQLGARTIWAERFVTRNSWGSDLILFYLGGPWDLRGYDFRRFAGRSIVLLNSEIRFPLIDRLSIKLPFGIVEMPTIRGAVFIDAGRVSRYLMNSGWVGSFGFGIELNLGYAPVIRVNFTRLTDFASIDADTGFELFIGYNY